MDTFKNTNSAIIHSILTTFLLLTLVSCTGSKSASYSRPTPDSSGSEVSDVPKSEYAKANKAVTTARSYLGTKYKYGGCSKSEGMDCSGLMFTTFKAVDIQLPRTSTAQSQMGKPVKMNDLQPGDLVFFTDKKGNTKITHVGMVTEVKGSKEVIFIHASTKAGVVENNLLSDYYQPIFIKAVRLF